MKIKYANWNGWFHVVIALALFLCGVATGEPTSVRDCYGYSVSDSAQIRDELQKQLDTVSDMKLIYFSIEFWTVPDQSPDSCRIVSCPGENDTLPGHYYRTWSQRFFTDHESYDYRDTIHPLVPGNIEVMPGYAMLLARKSTLLALSKECYAERMHPPLILVPVRKPNPKLRAAQRLGGQFDALGRKPESLSKLMNPSFALPSFMLR
jgi:hypothetical protein